MDTMTREFDRGRSVITATLLDEGKILNVSGGAIRSFSWITVLYLSPEMPKTDEPWAPMPYMRS